MHNIYSKIKVFEISRINLREIIQMTWIITINTYKKEDFDHGRTVSNG